MPWSLQSSLFCARKFYLLYSEGVQKQVVAAAVIVIPLSLSPSINPLWLLLREPRLSYRKQRYRKEPFRKKVVLPASMWAIIPISLFFLSDIRAILQLKLNTTFNSFKNQ